VRRQWSAFVASGLPCRFINGHHHLHVHPVVLREIERLVPSGDRPWLRGFAIRRFGRRGRPRTRKRLEPWLSPCLQHRLRRRHGWVLSDSLWGLDRLHAMQPDEVLAVVPTLSEGLHEFLFHPRATSGDTDFAALIRLRNWRQTLGRPD
jgi:hypothetical protein